jgi:hypothetical protein
MPIISFAMSNQSLNTASSRDCGSSRQVVCRVPESEFDLWWGRRMEKGDEARVKGTGFPGIRKSLCEHVRYVTQAMLARENVLFKNDDVIVVAFTS